MSKWLPSLSREYLNSIFVADFATGKISWRNQGVGRRHNLEGGCLCLERDTPYCRIWINGKLYKRSRIMYCMAYGKWPTLQIDHINRNSLDDRPENLREATNWQNSSNVGGKKNRKNKLPTGVTKDWNKFIARITVHYKHIYLGVFSNPEDAHMKYLEAKKQYCGEFAGE